MNENISGIKNSNVLLEDGSIRKCSVSIKNGRFNSFDVEDDAFTQYDDDLIVVPGFIDEHIHGCNGKDVMDGDEEALETMSETLVQEGVTSFAPTTMTCSQQEIEKALDNIAKCIKKEPKGARIIKAHLEGPFISDIYKGAQNPENIESCSPDLLKHYVDISEGNIGIVTFAYEENGAEMLKYMVDNGITPSIGHSNCDSSTLKKGIEEGIFCSTHTFNAMRGFSHREPGIVGEVLINDDVYCELIADLIHVHEDAIKLLFKSKPIDKIILISDSTMAKYLEEGSPATLGGTPVYLKDGAVRLENGVLAGSALRIDTALKNIRSIFPNMPLGELIGLSTANPAKNLGIYDDVGSISCGKRADFVVIDKDLNIKMTVVGGHVKYKCE